MEILSIGNSFSQDAQRYLHSIARANGTNINAYNLYIGGCSLATHHRNMLSEERAYILEMNGAFTGFNVSLKEALLNRNWDVITVQQVSSQSPDYHSYQPYLNALITYVRRLVPKAKIAIHQTWAYEQGSQRLHEELKYSESSRMLQDIICACNKAAEDIHADYIIPSGEVFQMLLQNGIKKVHRDTYHASIGLGRYALGLTWYSCLTGYGVIGNSFNNFDESISTEDIAIVQDCVTKVVQYARENFNA